MEDSEGEEDVHGIELGNLAATVVEEIGVTVVENFGFTLVRLGSTSMGLEIRLMPVGKLGAAVMFNLLVVVATKVMQVKKDQKVASALVGVKVKDSRKKICCKVVLLLLPSPDVEHSLPVAICALAAEAAAVTGLKMEGSRMYSGWLPASIQQWSFGIFSSNQTPMG